MKIRAKYIVGADGQAPTTFYQVTCWRQLAENTAQSLRRGDPVIVRGMLRGREWSSGERSGTSLEINADSVGHDLNRGITQLRRLKPPAPRPAAEPPVEQRVEPRVEQRVEPPVEQPVQQAVERPAT